METILERMEIRLDEMSKKLERLEVQNEILRKEIHGSRSPSTDEDAIALVMETKTLREVVAEIQVDVRNINAKLRDIETRQEDDSVPNVQSQQSKTFLGTEEKEESSDNSLNDDFNVEEIRSKTLAQEKDWLRRKFTEIRIKTVVQDGASLKGKNIEAISKSIPLSASSETSCVLKLTNGLKYAITDPKFHFLRGTKMTAPSVIAGHFSEVFLGTGNFCNFLCSISMSHTLRMAIGCVNDSTSQMVFYIGFIPHNIATDLSLLNKLNAMESTPDFSINKAWGKAPIELFIMNGQFLARGHMKALGSRAIVHVDILERAEEPANELKILKLKKGASNLKRTVEELSRRLTRSNNNDEDLKIVKTEKSCSVEIYNLLNVALRNRQSFYFGSKRHNFIPTEVLSLQGVTFFASDEKSVEGMFSYEIESTDLCLVVAFQVTWTENYFVGAFLPLPVPSNKQEMKKFMAGNHWKFCDWRKSAQAKEGEQVMEIRNIRASIFMTEGENSLLKIQIFAV